MKLAKYVLLAQALIVATPVLSGSLFTTRYDDATGTDASIKRKARAELLTAEDELNNSHAELLLEKTRNDTLLKQVGLLGTYLEGSTAVSEEELSSELGAPTEHLFTAKEGNAKIRWDSQAATESIRLKLVEIARSREAMKELNREIETQQSEIVSLGREAETNRKVKSLEYFRGFSDEDKGLGTFAASPFGDDVEYSVNAVNYNLHFSDEIKIPFQLFIGDVANGDNDDIDETNSNSLLDPTQGLAISFPIMFVYKPDTDKLCGFDLRDGYCIFGGDITTRFTELVGVSEEGDTNDEGIFSASISLGGAIMFPILDFGNSSGDKDGYLSLSANYRYYYHNGDESDNYFPGVEDPEGNPISFSDTFGAINLSSEMTIFDQFLIRAEYFKPTSQTSVLKDVFKLSLVFSPKD